MDGESEGQSPNITDKNAPPEIFAARVDLESTPNKDQQNRIIASFSAPDGELPRIINGEPPQVSDSDREKFLSKIATMGIGESGAKRILKLVVSPIDYETDEVPVNLHKQIKLDPQMSGIVAWSTIGFDNREHLSPIDIESFIDQYPDPVSFQKDAQKFLDAISESNSSEKVEKYRLSIKKLMPIMYGERWEYYQQMKLLQKEADEKYSRKSAPEIVPPEEPASREQTEILVDPNSIQRNRDQQNGIILALSMRKGDEPDYDKLVNNSGFPPTPATRGIFLERVAKGEIDDPQFQKLLQHIKPPLSYEKNPAMPDSIYGRIAKNNQMLGILAQFARNDFDQRGQLVSRDVIAFLNRFPDPVAFVDRGQQFLGMIKKTNTPEKAEEYRESMIEFCQIVYGKRWEYYLQILSLKATADENYPKAAEARKAKKNG